jgi:hypothetical protein
LYGEFGLGQHDTTSHLTNARQWIAHQHVNDPAATILRRNKHR